MPAADGHVYCSLAIAATRLVEWEKAAKDGKSMHGEDLVFTMPLSAAVRSHAQPLKCRSHGLRARCAAPESVRGHRIGTRMRHRRAEGSRAHRPRQWVTVLLLLLLLLLLLANRKAVCVPLK